MYSVDFTTQFSKDVKKCLKRGLDITLLYEVIEQLRQNGKLPQQYHPHILHGKYEGIWECHIKGDWLLLWEQNDNTLTLLMTNTGTHSDIF